jgi:dTDP-glucose pyrophosphorylase
MEASIQKICIGKDSSITTALKHMDAVNRKLLLVLNEDNSFFSLVSIGDIQRAIIKNLSLETPVSEIVREDITVASINDDLAKVKERMKSRRNEYMPVIDSNNKIVKVIFWEELFQEIRVTSKFELPVVIMAGGKGTRLKPLTNVIPKPLIPINEKTIIEHIFQKFAQYGCNDFYISVNYKAELIEYYLKEQQLNYTLSYLKESKPLGTAGSLSLLKGKINTTFFVTNCDILIEQDYHEILEYHRNNKNDITIVAAIKTFPIAYGTLETGENGHLIKLVEKPELTFKINSGMYILEPYILNEIPEGKFFHITQLIENVKAKKGKVGVFPVSEKSWKDIGTWEEYLTYHVKPV